MPNKEIWMQRAFDLALLGSGRVAPNPLVGCVIVKGDRIIGDRATWFDAPAPTFGGNNRLDAVGASRRPQKISHLGNVVIGDEVEIGSNCAIDRAKLASTYIRSGAKLDNICHIAHNCDLGEDGFYTAGFMMAGSTTIGRRS